MKQKEQAGGREHSSARDRRVELGNELGKHFIWLRRDHALPAFHRASAGSVATARESAPVAGADRLAVESRRRAARTLFVMSATAGAYHRISVALWFFDRRSVAGASRTVRIDLPDYDCAPPRRDSHSKPACRRQTRAQR